MSKANVAAKTSFHARNKHQGHYDFDVLSKAYPTLKSFITTNVHGNETIDFSNPNAVIALNKALLFSHYNLNYWDIPDNYLCPPIPGRAEYIHRVADVLAGSNFGKIPEGKGVKCVDIGVGANAIYPLIGHCEYGWSFIGSDIDDVSIASAKKVISENGFSEHIKVKKQGRPKDVLYGIIEKIEKIDLVVCNPPFHASSQQAEDGNARKNKNLGIDKPVSSLNFGGQSNELYCPGGEKQFVGKYIKESKNFAENVFWFSSLISKKDHVRDLQKAIKKLGATDTRVIDLTQGNKASRLIMWTFLNQEEQLLWKNSRWTKR
jgi:23S rRNA (adenine1618-N6)-methyltransferase